MRYVIEHDATKQVWRLRVPAHGSQPEVILEADTPLRLMADVEAVVYQLNQAWMELAVRAGLLRK